MCFRFTARSRANQRIIGAPLASAYSASKGGVIAMTRSLAMEWASKNFRVNVVCPGMIETEMTRRVMENKMMFDSNLSQIPMKKFGKPEDIATMVVFLASNAASYITGGVFVVDGGLTAR